MNQEGMDDRAYFSDWGGCTCDPEVNYFDPDCPYYDSSEMRCTLDDDFEEEGDE